MIKYGIRIATGIVIAGVLDVCGVTALTWQWWVLAILCNLLPMIGSEIAASNQK